MSKENQIKITAISFFSDVKKTLNLKTVYDGPQYLSTIAYVIVKNIYLIIFSKSW